MNMTEKYINELRDKYEFASDKFLREHKWKHTSSTPGCFWRWEKTLSDGRIILVDKDFALSIQYEINNKVAEPDKEHLERNPDCCIHGCDEKSEVYNQETDNVFCSRCAIQNNQEEPQNWP